jgi:hypothetical protein
MSDAVHSVDTLLAVDFGAANTRVSLFDVVEGKYRFVASGEAPTTVDAPYHEASEGMRHALAELQAVTGRVFFDESAQLILPATPDGRGADVLVATSSAGPAVQAVLIGLLPDVSLENARRIANTHYLTIRDTFSLGDTRPDEQRIDTLLRIRPDLLLITGGTENGAVEALVKMLDTVSLACHLLPPEHRIKVLFAGNSALQPQINEKFGAIASVAHAPNLQPDLGLTDLPPARQALAEVIESLRIEQIGGFNNTAVWTGGRIYPTAQAESNIVRFFSRAIGPHRGVLSVNVGSASTAVAAGFGENVSLVVRPDLGVGVNAAQILKESPIEALLRWVPFELPADGLRDFIYNKTVHPHTIPVDPHDAALEYVLVRQALALALRGARRDWWRKAKGPRADLMPWFDLIFAAGAALARAPRPGLAAMLILDALQPVGQCDLFLDAHHMGAALGALATVNPTAVVQILDSGAFLSLGTTFSAIGAARFGDVACVATLQGPDGENTVEVRYGSFEILPLAANQAGKLTLRPRPGFDVGFGPGRGTKNREITGGAAGILIDARGRPIAFPNDSAQRRDTVQKWIAKAAGEG